MDASEQIEKFQEFFEITYKKELPELVRKGKKSLVVDFSNLIKFDPDLAENLLQEPEEVIKAAEIALEQFDLGIDLRVRFNNLPLSQKIFIRDIRSKHINSLIFFEGIVRQSSDVRPQVVCAKFECPACGNTINVMQLEFKFKEPLRCSCGRKGRFRLLSKDLVDAQRLVIEESSEDLEGGSQPKRLSIFLREDLVEPKMEKKTTPGNKVRVFGIIKEVPILLSGGGFSTRFDLVMNCNYIESVQEEFAEVEIKKEDEEEIIKLSKDPKIYEKFRRSIAPSIYGHEKLKEALVLQLMGGVRKVKEDGTVTRGDMHILLVGDPGAGKSALLTFIAGAAPKARYIAGKGASSAGLCVAPDSFILTNPGKIYEIKSVVEEKLKNNNCKLFDEGVLQAKNPKSDKKIFTLDENFKVRPTKISQFWKIKAPERMVRITTQSGKSITTTPNTKIYTIFNGRPYWREANSLEEGDYVATSRELRFKNRNKQLVINLLESNPIVYGVKKHIKKIIEILCLKYNMNKRELANYLSINENKLYHNWVNEKARGNICLKDLIRLTNKANYPIEKVAKDIKRFSLYRGRSIKLPVYINKDLLYFAGLISGDGDLSNSGNTISIRLSNNSKEIQNKFISLSKKLFNVKTNLSSRKTKKRAESRRFSSKLVFEVLNSLGIPLSPKSYRIDMSNILLNLPNDYLASFLRGYFDADGGSVERESGGSSYIECSTTSRIFAKKLQLVLLRYGIYSKFLHKKARPNERISSKHGKYILKIVGKENLLNFKNHIGFGIAHKKQKLSRIISKIKLLRTNIDIIPGANALLKELRDKNKLTSRELAGYKTSNYFSGRFNISKNNLKRILMRLKNRNIEGIDRLYLLANSDVFWEKIINKEVVKPDYDYVYDLTVENSHNFLVNGFVVHNTASVVKDEFLRGWALEAGALVLANKGICVTGDTEILGAENKIYTIKQIMDKFKNGENIKVKCLDYPNFNIKDAFVKNVTKRLPDKLFLLEFDTGDVLRITEEHPLLVWNNGFFWKKVREIKEGDIVVTPLSIPSDDKLIKISELVDYNLTDLPEYLDDSLMEFLGLIITDGHLSNKKYKIAFYTKDDELKERFCKLAYILFQKEVKSYLDKRSNVYHLYFYSKNIHTFLQRMGIKKGNKSKQVLDLNKIYNLPNSKIKSFLVGVINGDGSISNRVYGGCVDIVTGLEENAEQYRKLFRKLGVIAKVKKTKLYGGGIVKRGNYIGGRLTITGVSNLMKIYDERIMTRKLSVLKEILRREDKSWAIPNIDCLFENIRDMLVHTKKHLLYKNSIKVSLLKKGFGIKRRNLKKILDVLRDIKEIRISSEYRLLESIYNNNLYFTKVKRKKKIPVEIVYNLEVDHNCEPNYFANFIPVHNCVIDELDKMSVEDTSALHEGMEQQRITIAKANIQATLMSETTVLAAANPKFGRFNPYNPIAEQIDLPPALINRFDLVFTLRDLPDRLRDSKIAQHVLGSIPGVSFEPEIPIKTLRKYIAYAKQKIFPKMTEGAMEEIKNFYVELRNTETSGDAALKPIPVSARQLEALVRLSEGSARIRLSNKVTKKDARKAIDLLKSCLVEVGIDPETGQIDIDRLSSGITATTRNKILIVRELIVEIEKKTGKKAIPIDDLIAEADDKKIDEPGLMDIIEKLKKEGEIFEPKGGFIQRI
jgi:DNA replicative helicase MCM subunit Mcm2 (Cdc46/Mcm family)